MITGYNANVRHGGRVFHVQTEDSGRSHPHVITHLYYEGTILASERRDYAEMVHAPDLVARVRQLMEEQHAAMIERLRRGEFDRAIAARVAAPAAGRTAAAPAAPAEMATPAAPGAAPRPARAPAPAPPAAAAAAPPAPRVAAAATPGPAAGAAPAPQPSRARAFGEGIVSERPLDDVILEYLVARSRDRAGGGRGSRSEG
jgi:hypothetical protein